MVKISDLTSMSGEQLLSLATVSGVTLPAKGATKPKLLALLRAAALERKSLPRERWRQQQ
jgi:hypothetical protein